MYVRGVGPRVGKILEGKGILVAEDLLYHLPFRYEDRQHPRSLDELKPGEMASVIAEVMPSQEPICWWAALIWETSPTLCHENGGKLWPVTRAILRAPRNGD